MFRNSLYYPTPSKEICIEVTLWLSLFGYSFFLCQFEFSIQMSVTLIVCAWDSKLKLFLAYLTLKEGRARCLFSKSSMWIYFFLLPIREIISDQIKIDKRNIDKVDISISSFQGVIKVFLQVCANFFCGNNYLRIHLALKYFWCITASNFY